MCSPTVLAVVRERLKANHGVNRRQMLGATGVAIASAAAIPSVLGAQGATPVAPPIQISITDSTVVDLTHVMTPDMPVWPGNEPFNAEVIKTHEDDGFYAQSLSFWEHTGTHLDGPAHFVDGGETAEFLPVENFVAPLVVIDISVRANDDFDATVMVEDIEEWESTNGPIPDRAFIAMHSGWAARINDPKAFVNLDDEGIQHYPGFHPDVTTMLVEERNVVGIGVDTLSLDPGNSTDFGSHIAVLGAGRYGVEGLANLDRVPAVGGTIVVGAPKHLNASGGPSRVIALI